MQQTDLLVVKFCVLSREATERHNGQCSWDLTPESLKRLVSGLGILTEIARQKVVRRDAVCEGQAPGTLAHVVKRVGVGVALPGGGPDDDQRWTLVGRHVLPWKSETITVFSRQRYKL